MKLLGNPIAIQIFILYITAGMCEWVVKNKMELSSEKQFDI
jgi:hypothetical protein